MHHFDKKNNKGFTLMEVMVVVAVIGIVLQIVTSILITIIRQQTSVMRFSEVKNEGDQLLTRIKTEIATKAKRVFDNSGTEFCLTQTSDVVSRQNSTPIWRNFRDSTNNNFRFIIVTPTPPGPTGVPMIQYVGATNQLLSSTKSRITNFSISCAKPGSYSGKIVSIDFDISSTQQLMFAEGRPSLHYSTKILLKE